MTTTCERVEAIDKNDAMMLRLQNHDESAFTELVKSWTPPLDKYFHDRGMKEDAADLLQETFLVVYSQRYRYELDGRFLGWIFTIASCRLIDMQRRRKCRVKFCRMPLDGGLDGVTPDVEDTAESIECAVELYDEVESILDDLPDEQGVTFIMHHFDGLLLSEVAVLLKTTLPTTKSRYRLARETLRYTMRCRGWGLG